jgi:hypothetical protein
MTVSDYKVSRGEGIIVTAKIVLTFAVLFKWRDARAVDWGGLENRCPRKWTQGSNPCLSATIYSQSAEGVF